MIIKVVSSGSQLGGGAGGAGVATVPTVPQRVPGGGGGGAALALPQRTGVTQQELQPRQSVYTTAIHSLLAR